MPRRVLIFLAALVWTSAAGILFYRGFSLLEGSGLPLRFVLMIASLAGFIFWWILFARISLRYVLRIFRLKSDKPCIFAFFSVRSYILMLLMIASGVLLRYSGALDPALIGLFYLIMGLPLFLSSVRFWYYGLRYFRLKEACASPEGVTTRLPIWQRRLWAFFSFTLTLLILLVFYTNWRISWSTAEYIYDDISKVPENMVALVPGTSSKLANGSTNLYFKYRIEAVAELYKARKIRYVILSGDNGTKSYNEPKEMKAELIRQGVPDSVIYPDYAGFRTFDSVIRAWKVFGQKRYTFVSQLFQNERAIYIARAHGIEAIGYNAKDVGYYSGFKTKTREMLARVNVFLDLYLLNKQPRFLGDPIHIGDDQESAESDLK